MCKKMHIAFFVLKLFFYFVEIKLFYTFAPQNQKNIMRVFHTQESREKELSFPQKCLREDAWLGEAYYFWKEIEDAEDWGYSSKRRTGYFEVYDCILKSENYLDTVFNEDHYYFWLKQLEKIAKTIIKKTKEKPTLKELNDYIFDRGIWREVDFIQFQDLPTGEKHSFVKPITYNNGKIRTIAFRKRIQIAVYNPNIIQNFSFLKQEKI